MTDWVDKITQGVRSLGRFRDMSPLPDERTFLEVGEPYEMCVKEISHRWERDGGRIPELFVGGEGLARGGREVLGTLLHEAVHGVSPASGRSRTRAGKAGSTTPGSRALAEELGLAVAKTGSIGWSATTVPDTTAALYRAEVCRPDAAIVAYRYADTSNGRGGRASSNNGGWRPGASAGAGSASPKRC